MQKGIPFTPVRDLNTVRESVLEHIDQTHADMLVQLMGDATPAERDTWPIKLKSALAYLANTATADELTLINSEVNLTGEDATTFCQYVVARNHMTYVIIGGASGMRRAARAAVKAATAVEEIDTAFETFQTMAETAAANIAQGQAT